MAFLITLTAFILAVSSPARAGEADTIPLPTGAAGPAVPAGTLRPPTGAAAAPAVPNPSALPPPLPELMLPSLGARSVQITAHPTGAGPVPALTTVPAAPGGVQTTRVIVSPTPLTAVAARPSGAAPLPPVGSIASPLAASATPPPPVPVTSPLVGALVAGQREVNVPPAVQAVPMTPITPTTPMTPMTPMAGEAAQYYSDGQATQYYSETAASYGGVVEQPGSAAAVPVRSASTSAGRRSGRDGRGERRERAERTEPRYDPFPLRFDDMDQYDRIAMDPYRDRYDDLSIDEKVSLYGQQFELMYGRPPRFDPRATGEEVPPEPELRRDKRERPEYADANYDVLPLRFADMDQYDQMAMEPYRDRYDTLSIDEKVALYGQQFESMHGRRPRFDPRATGEMPPEPERRTDRRERAEHTDTNYDVLPLRFADMDQYDQMAMEPYRERYDRLSVGEKASLYGKQFEFMRGRPPRFDPRVSIEAERFMEASQATDIVAKRQSMYKPALAKPRAPRPEEQSEALLGALPGPWEQEAPPPPPDDEEPTYHDFDEDNRMESLRQGWNAMDVIRGRRQR